MIGEIRFRPHLEPPYEKFNGHTGYKIRPSYRGKGYGTRWRPQWIEIENVQAI